MDDTKRKLNWDKTSMDGKMMEKRTGEVLGSEGCYICFVTNLMSIYIVFIDHKLTHYKVEVFALNSIYTLDN